MIEAVDPKLNQQKEGIEQKPEQAPEAQPPAPEPKKTPDQIRSEIETIDKNIVKELNGLNQARYAFGYDPVDTNPQVEIWRGQQEKLRADLPKETTLPQQPSPQE